MRVYTIRGYEDYDLTANLPAPRRMVSRYVPVSGTMVDADTLETVSVTPFDVDDTDLDADIAGVVGLQIESDADDTDTDSKTTTTPVQTPTRGRGRPSMTPTEKALTAAHRAGKHGLPVADCPTCKRHS